MPEPASSSAPAEGDSRPAAAPQVGDAIGPYHVMALLGEGGMGSVYLCEQKEPVRRRVALKLVKLGMDSAEVLRRFDIERQALAVMSHDSIARVFDCGTSERGRPYFVMEYVKGLPITTYCDQHKLSLAARLDLFQQVCSAVQHAHQKGVVHRDLKPNNVLVTDEGGKPVPKVIDFGLARATDHFAQQQSQFTEIGAILGTPEYMSPEQADSRVSDIDTRTDIYSLGVMLYELLTGQLPFSAKDLRKAGLREMLRVIREVDPPRPSTRLSSHGDSNAIAASRQTTASTLQRSLRGDLDWVVLKALEKDRSRRYETANGLARDIQRFLAGEVLEARPPSATYRLRKFVRRNRGGVLVAVVTSALLLVGVVGLAWQAQRERELRQRAELAESGAQRRADELQQVARYQARILEGVDPTTAGVHLMRDLRARHAAALQKANVPDAERATRTSALDRELGSISATDAAVTLLDETVLAPAVRMIASQFAEQPLVDATLRSTLGKVYQNLGRNQIALQLHERAHALRVAELGAEHPETLASLGGVGQALGDLQRLAEAEVAVRASYDGLRRAYGDDQPETLAAYRLLAMQKSLQGKYDEAEGIIVEVLERHRRVSGPDDVATLSALAELGRLRMLQGRYDDAAEPLQQAIDAQRRLAAPELCGTLGTWGSLLTLRDQWAAAEPVLRESLKLCREVRGEDHRDTTVSLSRLSALLLRLRRFEESESLTRELLERCLQAFGREHAETLKALNSLGQVLHEQGRLGEAEPYLREALDTGRRVLGPDHPDTVIWISNMGSLMNQLGRPAEAEPLFREATETYRRVQGFEHPYSRAMFIRWIDTLRRQAKYTEVEAMLLEELERIRRDAGEDDPEFLTMLGTLGGNFRDQGKLAEAEEHMQRALEKSRRVRGETHPDTVIATLRLASLRAVQGQHAAVIALLEPIQDLVPSSFTGVNRDLRQASLVGMLGRARAGLAKSSAEWTAAEAQMLEARETFVRLRGPTDKEAREWTQALVELYEAWSKAEPGAGHEEEAAEWRKIFEEKR